MAVIDPARAPKVTNLERRKNQQEACKQQACNTIRKGSWPACTFCPHETQIIK